MRVSLEDFVILKVIGRGVMGKVMLVRHKTSRKLFALKSIHKDWILTHNQVQHARSERAILAAFSDSFYNVNNETESGFLVKLHASFQTSTEIFHVLDFMAGGDLASILARDGRLDEEKAKFVAAEIAVGLHLLHSKDIIYRDLKPENVLLDSRGHVVLTDFGLSKIIVSNSKTNTFCGTAEYLAPEILKGQAYDRSVDWWSYGTMLYEMICGVTPYWSENASIMYRKILYDPKLEFPSFISAEAKDIIVKLLSRTPCQRLDYEGIRNHSFFANLDWSAIENRSLNSPMLTRTSSQFVDDDTSAFDTEFTRMQPAITPVDPEIIRLMSKPESQEPFSGFSYFRDF